MTEIADCALLFALAILYVGVMATTIVSDLQDILARSSRDT
jgi:hypothetical protein